MKSSVAVAKTAPTPGVLEKQLEYMRRMVHQAELERSKAAEKVSQVEKEREEQEVCYNLLLFATKIKSVTAHL